MRMRTRKGQVTIGVNRDISIDYDDGQHMFCIVEIVYADLGNRQRVIRKDVLTLSSEGIGALSDLLVDVLNALSGADGAPDLPIDGSKYARRSGERK